MASFDDEPTSEDEIDLDRIVMDAEYRRRVLVQLRLKRVDAEPKRRSAPAETGNALRPDD